MSEVQTILGRLKIHAEKKEIEPMRRLLNDPQLQLLASITPLALGNQWGTVIELLKTNAEVEALTLDSPLAMSGMEVRTVNLLEHYDYVTFRDVLGVPDDKLREISGFGESGLADLHKWRQIAAGNTRRNTSAGDRTMMEAATRDVSQADIEKAIRADRMGSNSKIAKLLGISDQAVCRVRKAMEGR